MAKLHIIGEGRAKQDKKKQSISFSFKGTKYKVPVKPCLNLLVLFDDIGDSPTNEESFKLMTGFLNYQVPEIFREALLQRGDMEDVAEVFEIWAKEQGVDIAKSVGSTE